jgi:hypothetical protein
MALECLVCFGQLKKRRTDGWKGVTKKIIENNNNNPRRYRL